MAALDAPAPPACSVGAEPQAAVNETATVRAAASPAKRVFLEKRDESTQNSKPSIYAEEAPVRRT
ncbi:hypothetical protein GCM10010106_42810 [Thermopolyspora flexuosa]|nr:hypothetical protein GCM10010106_42810 [Thermopolyspora flexuosa]